MNETLGHFLDLIDEIRGGTVDQGFVESVKVSYYGSPTLIKNMASTKSDGTRITINPWDISIISEMEQSLKAAGLNAYIFSKNAIIVEIPSLSGEGKQKIKDHIAHLAEDTRIAIRNIRRSWRKDISGSEDEVKNQEKELENTTSLFIERIDGIVERKYETL